MASSGNQSTLFLEGGGGEDRDALKPNHEGNEYLYQLMTLEDVDADATGEDCTLADEHALFAYQDQDISEKLHKQRQAEQRMVERARRDLVGQWVYGAQGVVTPL
jgi:hypothetical protein